MGLGSSTVCSISLNTSLTPEQRDRFQNGSVIQDLLATAKTIAVVGLSTESVKASNMVASYLKDEGYRIVPIHPKASSILGETAYPSLLDVPFEIDVVDVFRPSNEIPLIAEQAVKIGAKALWTQLRIVHFEAGDYALEHGLKVVMDKCIKMEHGRYGGMLHWAGMNTELISAKRRRINAR